MRFDPALFSRSGEYLYYAVPGDARPTFIARFKYQRSSARGFQSFLTAHFEVEEYLAAIAAGCAPLTVLESKGYLQPHVRRALREAGYPLTAAGKAAYLREVYGPSLDRAAAKVTA